MGKGSYSVQRGEVGVPDRREKEKVIGYIKKGKKGMGYVSRSEGQNEKPRRGTAGEKEEKGGE